MLPAALELLVERLAVRDRKWHLPFAEIRSDLWTRWRDPEKHPEPFRPDEFLPALQGEESKSKSDADADGISDDMREFIDSLARGEKPGADPEALARTLAQTKAMEVELTGVGKTTNIGPSGKREVLKKTAL